MKAGAQTLEKLFESPKLRFEIPEFQRAYVWTLEDQWEPLWEDIRNLAERYVEQLEGGHDRLTAQQNAGRHFLGAVVVQHNADIAWGGHETYELIDGQQRITTLQLVLDAVQEVFEAHGHAMPGKQLAKMVLNDRDLYTGDDLFKLWPTGSDRDGFRAAMTNGADRSGFSRSQVVAAHEYFRVQVSEWLTEPGAEVEHRVQALMVTLLALLEVVVIRLGPSDDAFVIFETMNARGTPLLASDLVKNYVLQAATKEGLEPKTVHANHWAHFESTRDTPDAAPWWRQEVRQGRIYRPRLDILLNHWLVMRRGKSVRAREIFREFKDFTEADARGIVPILGDVGHVAETYRGLDRFDPWSVEGTFLYRWRVVQAGVLTPVLLLLFSAPPSVLSVERRARALNALESFLVRRMACRLTTKDYNRLFIEGLVGELSVDLAHADDVVHGFLAAQTAWSRIWPDDDRVVDHLVHQALYGRINQQRIRMILEALENALRSAKTEDSRVARNLTIEHVLPQKWQTHWPLTPVEDPELHHRRIGERERLKHSLGNLTLVTGGLNSAASNAAWPHKQGELAAHSTLHLNKRLLGAWSDVDFDEDAIIARGRGLAELFCAVWPHADAL